MALRRRRHPVPLPPPTLLFLAYAALIALGTVLLLLPVSTRTPITLADAAFTATSAVTVTGLAVLDTGQDFTLFGQAVILFLFQLGGLGIMAFAVLFMSVLGLPVGFAHRVYLREDLAQTSATDLIKLVEVIFRAVVIFELVGAALLAVAFVPGLGWGQGLWASLFHAVSAFNNAGFSLFSDSLTGWVGNPVVNLVVPLLLIAGGLGFTVTAEIWKVRSWRRYSLHTKLMLTGTAGLLVLSTIGFAAMEWTNPATLGGLDLPTRLWASWFQATTTRTAGFNTLDFGQMSDSTTLMTLLLMVIGAGSTSTGGGIKVTTFLVLVLATVAFFRRRTRVDVFGRSLSSDQVLKVLALTMVSFLTVMAGLFLTTLMHAAAVLDLLFEGVSACGTVGLARGVTTEFDTAGRLVLMAMMFVGRVGPLMLGFLLAQRGPRRIAYPEGNVLLG